jgi:hypothetical protein
LLHQWTLPLGAPSGADSPIHEVNRLHLVHVQVRIRGADNGVEQLPGARENRSKATTTWSHDDDSSHASARPSRSRTDDLDAHADGRCGEEGVDRLIGGPGKKDICNGGPAKDRAKKCEKVRSL